MIDLVESLGSAAPWGAALVIAVLLGIAVSGEVRRHQAQRAREQAEQRQHELRAMVVKAQVSQAESQRTAGASLTRELDNRTRHTGNAKQLEMRKKDLDRLRAELAAAQAKAENLEGRLREMHQAGAPDDDLSDVALKLGRAQARLVAINDQLAREAAEVSKLRHPSGSAE